MRLFEASLANDIKIRSEIAQCPSDSAYIKVAMTGMMRAMNERQWERGCLSRFGSSAYLVKFRTGFMTYRKFVYATIMTNDEEMPMGVGWARNCM